MSNTQIKRLYQDSTEFVPITLAEAVVVNSDKIGLSSLKITTLDKVLKSIIGITGTNALDIDTLEKTIKQINTQLTSKQDKLTSANAGTGITITEVDGVLKINSNATFELYKVVEELPENPAKAQQNTIYIVPSAKGIFGNEFLEYISVKRDGVYKWEQLGTVSTEINLDGYITREEYNREIGKINLALKDTISAKNVTTSAGSQVFVDYNIPADLYDSLIKDSKNHIIQL